MDRVYLHVRILRAFYIGNGSYCYAGVDGLLSIFIIVSVLLVSLVVVCILILNDCIVTLNKTFLFRRTDILLALFCLVLCLRKLS